MKAKKGFKMPSSVVIILSIISLFAILSWIVPSTEYLKATGEFVPGETKNLGLSDIVMSVVKGFRSRSDLIVFIIALGGFMGITMKTGMLEALIGALLKKLQGKEIWLIPILMFIFAIGGTTFGLAEETIALAIVIIPVFVLAGFDSVTALMVLLYGPSIGFRASTTNPFGLGTAIDSVNKSLAPIIGKETFITLGDGMLYRVFAFAILYALFTGITIWYALRVKRDPSKSLTRELNEAIKEKAHQQFDLSQIPEFTLKRKITLGVFIGSFALLVLGVVPWENFGITIFSDIHTWSLSNPVGIFFNGTTAALGHWWFNELTMLFIVSAIILGLVNGMKEDEIISEFYAGAKDLFGVVMIIAVSAGVGIILTDSGMQYTILDKLISILKGTQGVVFVVLNYIFIIPLSLLIPSSSGLAGVIFPILGPTAHALNSSPDFVSLVVTSFSLAMGTIDSLSPTSSVVMGLLAIAAVPFEKWAKMALPLSVIGFFISIGMITIFEFMI